MQETLASRKRSLVLAAFVLLILTLAMFGDVLFSQGGRVLSREGLDLYRGEMFGLEFEFGEIKKGNFPLWNPHVYSGVPFFDGVSSTALYPLNYLHLFFPLGRAINIGIALHTFLIGFFIYLWTSHRRLHPVACLLSAALGMFSSPYFLHIFAGHLVNLCAMTWVPLIFLSIDGLVDRPSAGWCFLGIFAVTMQVLAAQPQYVYYTAIAAGLYCLFLLAGASQKKLFILGLTAILLGSLLLSFVQIWPALVSAREGIRSLGVNFRYSAMFSFPPENFLTLLAPAFFGDMKGMPYWGRCYLWEMTLFIGVTGLFLALCGVFYGARGTRRYSASMAVLLLLLSLGVHTPLFKLLYQYLPGFNNFRGTSKFIFPASLFLAMLAGIGMDALLKRRQVSRNLFWAPLATGALLLAMVSLIPAYPKLWSQLMQFVGATGESYVLPGTYSDAAFLAGAGQFASHALLISSGICFVLALLLILRKYRENTVYLMAVLAFAEVFVFASMNRPTFDIAVTKVDSFKRFYREHPGDYRVLSQFIPNMAVATGGRDIWGYGPAVPKRYAELIAFTQGADPDKDLQAIRLKYYHPLFKMLRCRYVITQRAKDILIQDVAPQILPRLLLVQDWKMLKRRDDIFQEMTKTTFDARRTVILESQPLPPPVRGKKAGILSIEAASTDFLRLRGKLEQAAILLITDSYSSGWRARALPGSGQTVYNVMPANYALMAVPLAAGEQRLVLEYRPRSYQIGKGVSLISLGICLLAMLWYLGKRRRIAGGENK